MFISIRWAIIVAALRPVPRWRVLWSSSRTFCAVLALTAFALEAGFGGTWATVGWCRAVYPPWWCEDGVHRRTGFSGL